MSSGRLVKSVLGVLLATFIAALSGCQSPIVYYDEASPHLANGKTDPRVIYSRMISERLEPLVLSLPEKKGRLAGDRAFEKAFTETVRPLDILVARSPAGFIRNTIPSYYTHAIQWIGTEAQLKSTGLWNLPEMRPFHADIQNGMVAVEAFGKDVRFIGLERVLNRDEMIMLRPSKRSDCRPRETLRRIKGQLGKPFDTNFDLSDTAKLTCIELAREICPALNLPVRYSLGRLALIPDDVVRFGLSAGSQVGFVAGFASGRGGELVQLRAEDVARRLTQPKKKPPFLVY